MLLYYLSLIKSDDDKSKFEKLYTHYRNLMFYAANGILKNKSDCEDAVHDAFLRLIKYIDRIEDVYSTRTKALVVITAESAAKDIYRKQKKIEDADFGEDIPYDTDEKTAFQDFDAKLLCEKIGELPEKYRDILLLRCVHGYEYSEISDLLKISESAARKRLERAKIQLAQLIGEEETV